MYPGSSISQGPVSRKYQWNFVSDNIIIAPVCSLNEENIESLHLVYKINEFSVFWKQYDAIRIVITLRIDLIQTFCDANIFYKNK